jgi:hypothetical protein
VKPQRTRCAEWVMVRYGLPHAVRCRRPLTHRVVGRWKNYPGGCPERVLMCEAHAAQYVRGNSPYSSAVISAYRVRRGNR